jgi:ribosome-associated protein
VTNDERKPSKTQRKKQVTALQDLGVELVELKDEQLAALDLPENLLDAVMVARRVPTFEAKRRQLQYIGKIMRKVDAVPIRAALDALQAGPRREVALHKRADSWRERLLASDAALSELVREYPRADTGQLRSLIESTLREREKGLPPRHFRALYQALRALIEGKA